MANFSFFPGFGRRNSVVLQDERSECGLACLAMIATHYGKESSIANLRSQFGSSTRGVTLSKIIEMASSLDLASRPLRLEMRGLPALRLPAILHWKFDHFVVLERVNSRHLQIIDPGVGRRKIPISEARTLFTGVALELRPTPEFQEENETRKLTFSDMLRSAHGLKRSLLKIFAISIVIQAISLIVPLYTQFVIDDVISSKDTGLLVTVTAGFLFLSIFGSTVALIRKYAILYLGANLQFGWSTQLFHHLVRLPLGFFEKRAMADVLSRFRSIGAIQALVSASIVEVVLDGIMALTTLIVMLMYGPWLSLVSFSALAIYTVVRIVMFTPQLELSNEAIVLQANEDGHFLETLRGMLAIKAFGREHIRESTWQSKAADAIRGGLRSSNLNVIQKYLNELVFGFENVLVIAIGAATVMSGELTVGMLVAFISYKSQFTSRTSALIDKVVEFKLARVHFDRIADIALQERDRERVNFDSDSNLSPRPNEAHPTIKAPIIILDNVGYRYSALDPWVFRNISFEIQLGEFVAIRGPSGLGKTTLLKVMMGLLEATEGTVIIDGIDVSENLPQRGVFSAVMQDDALLSGSLADNIAFFDSPKDHQRIEACGKLAAIHEEVSQMPMRYDTLVGDMGSALSGGQKQRVLLARALYQEPKILFLDEATSHLDAASEKKVHSSVEAIKITRVAVAHRSETLALADRVIDLRNLIDSA